MADTQEKPKKRRGPQKPRPLYITYQIVTDDEGHPAVRFGTASRNAGKVLQAIDLNRNMEYATLEVE